MLHAKRSASVPSPSPRIRRKAACAEPLERRSLLTFGLTVQDVALVESDGGTSAVFTLQGHDVPATRGIQVNYATRDGVAMAARAGEDYEPRSGELTFGFGVTTRTVIVPVVGDEVFEGDEAFDLTWQWQDGLVSQSWFARAMVLDDDERADSPVTVSNTYEQEPSRAGEERFLRWTVSLREPLEPGDDPVSVVYTTVAGTGSNGMDNWTAGGQLTFLPGEPASKVVSAKLIQDAQQDGGETICLNVYREWNNTTGYTDLLAQGVGAILDPGSGVLQPAARVNNVVVNEGDGAGGEAVFTVSVYPFVPAGASIDFNTVEGSAKAGTDFEPRSGRLTLPPSARYGTIAVPLVGDTTAEFDEVFGVELTAAENAWLYTPVVGAARVVNDDPLPTVSIANATLTEGDAGQAAMTFEVRLSAPSALEAQVQAAVALDGGGSATAGTDFVAPPTATRLTFAPGETVETFSVPVNGDETPEPDETFHVRLVSAFQATLADASAVGTIVDDDASRVVGRHVFYNNSAFDGRDPMATAADDAALALDKSPLLPGAAASFANVTSYNRGINGVMVDVQDLPQRWTRDVPQPQQYFSFRWGASADRSTWQEGPPAARVTVRPGAGVGGSGRLTLTWPDYNPFVDAIGLAVANGWLEVTVLANEYTGLASPDVFAYGNLIGETGFGNTAEELVTNAADVWMVRRQMFRTTGVTSRYDINRDGRVSPADLGAMRWGLFQRLPLPEGGPGLAASQDSSEPRLAELVLS